MECTKVNNSKSGQFAEVAYLGKTFFFLGVIKTKEDNYNKKQAQYLEYTGIPNFGTDIQRATRKFSQIYRQVLLLIY